MLDLNQSQPIVIGGRAVPPGRKVKLQLPFTEDVTGGTESLPVVVINGRSAGPHVWLSAAIHGDELNGIQIIRRVLAQLDAKNLRGALIAAPIVNPLGFMIASRYLPDRRDLNRSFPGSKRGSTASRLAHLFMSEVVAQCSAGIDLHTASNHRTNIPQVRADTDDPTTLELARAFGAPFTVHARVRDGSLRQAATEQGKTVLVYEGGQAHRFDEEAISAGVTGVLRALKAVGMHDARLVRPKPTTLLRRTHWVRARRGGIADIQVNLGEQVKKGQPIALISDAFGIRPTTVKSPVDGWVVARALRPIVISGDPLVHIGAEQGPARDEPAERRR
ncbi:MAG: succinylglutamate desuccinylase/aspartoacylase family protein [Acidimicrobiia bacterium]